MKSAITAAGLVLALASPAVADPSQFKLTVQSVGIENQISAEDIDKLYSWYVENGADPFDAERAIKYVITHRTPTKAIPVACSIAFQLGRVRGTNMTRAAIYFLGNISDGWSGPMRIAEDFNLLTDQEIAEFTRDRNRAKLDRAITMIISRLMARLSPSPSSTPSEPGSAPR